MNNLIKAEFYRIKNSMFFNIIILVTFILGITSSRSNVKFVDINGFGFFLELNAIKPIDALHTAMGATPILIIIIIMLINNIVVDKYNGGITRQAISYGYNRRDIYIASLIVINVCTVIITLIFNFMCFILKVDISSLDLNTNIILIKEFILYIILICTISSFYTFICIVVKSKFLSATIYVAFSIFFVTIFGELLRDNTTSLMLMNIASNGISNVNVLKYILISIVVVLCSVLLGVDYFSKVDIF
ncbi:hypothetical protein [Clostridium ihumii]|uniref:hypothetical protein n=1 Tax=Clostridium ihumii TaxID=1470356 RepID=UPI00058E1D57|nr:hypothetical protein [Clostridium ihumii]